MSEDGILLDPDDFEQTDIFDAVVRVVELRDGDYGRQVVIEVEPTSFEYTGEYEYMPLYFKYSESDRSNWYKFTSSVKNLGIRLKELSDLEGLHLRWERCEDEYEIDGETKVSRYSLPVKKLKPVGEQSKLAGGADGGASSSSSKKKKKDADADADAESKSDAEDSLQDAVLGLIDDGEPHPVTELYDALGDKGFSKGKVLRALRQMDSEGLVVLADNNVIME